MDYTQLNTNQREEMYAEIGIASIDELFDVIPSEIQCVEGLDLMPALSELELQRALSEMASHNHGAHDMTCFMGCGAYDHFYPALIDQLTNRAEFLTSYTPYQAEASQGSLQAFFEFQTQIARLTGLDIANASLYDGATAVAEAALLAINSTRRKEVLVASTLQPEYIAVLRTVLSDLDITITVLESTDGKIAPSTVEANMSDEVAGVIVQSPNIWGVIEDWDGCFSEAHKTLKTAAIAVFNPIACGVLKTPGECSADIAAGEGQPLGNPLNLGGPYLGLLAAKESYIRKMPGRLVGMTNDEDGRRVFCLTLQTREQHIRGAKATSNVCTNQGLMALRASIFMTALGSDGIREIATQCWNKAHYLAQEITKLDGWELIFDGDFFNEFTVKCPCDVTKVVDFCKSRGVLCGVAAAGRRMHGLSQGNELIIAVTEKRTKHEIDTLVDLFGEVAP
ncbi:MAG: aminomethyl-transferring glycine dehydrogenase subunit GcvPA [Phycisphaerales bacterium]|nr:aminomethyl-transferring glycine dehydrogenase subunit GcvPA [Planctomycetota bacterium]MBL6997156.1 aminomethyl-transferring glycine dehydrogenase subunit GcvPA [Phycisphaerales bacterium]